MKSIGYIIVGMEGGLAFASYLARHGAGYTRQADMAHLFLGFIVWTILVFA